MCNPPFFESLEQKIDNPHTSCNATDNELVTKGGELHFVSQMIEDSLVLRDRIRWYTSMIGRKVNLTKLVKLLHKHKIRNVCTTTFYQGYTTRWALGWSFSDEGYEELVKEHIIKSVVSKRQLSFTMSDLELSNLMEILEQFLKNNDISYSRKDLLINANMYESSRWWLQKLGKEESDSVCSSGIGPMMPPKLVFSFEIQVFDVHKQFTVLVMIKKGDDLCSFGELCAALKLSVQKMISF